MKSSRTVLVLLGVMTIVLVGGTVALALGLTQGDDSDSATKETLTNATRLERAHASCGFEDEADTIKDADDGATLIIDTQSDEGALKGLTCLFDKLGTSSAVRAQVASTTAMMGAQEGRDDGLSYRWSYHPENGLNMTITEDR